MKIIEMEKRKGKHFTDPILFLTITSEKIKIEEKYQGIKKTIFQTDTIMPNILSISERKEGRKFGALYFQDVQLESGKVFTFRCGHSLHKHLVRKEYSVQYDVDGERYIKDETRANFKHLPLPPIEFVKYILKLNIENLENLKEASLFRDEITEMTK